MKASTFTRILPLLIAILAVVHLFRSPYSASNCEVVPETGEYAIGAQRLATLGRYDIEIDRVSYPPRYPPWLSLMMTPLYWIRPAELGMGILLVLAFAVGAVLCAYEIGRLLGNEVGGAIAAVLLIHNGVFSWDARQIAPDIPALALSLACGILFLRAVRDGASWRLFLLAGLCGGIAGAMRSLSYAALLPMLLLAIRSHPQRVRRLMAIALPPLCFALATAIYNRIRFGGYLRDGYQYWAPIPHQFLNLLFSPRYLAQNLAAVAPLWWLLIGGLAGLLMLWKSRRDLARPMAAFVALAAVPVSLIHLFYFWGDPRFHLLLIATMFITMGAGFGLIFAPSSHQSRWLLPILMVASAFLPIHPPTPEPTRRQIADQLRAGTPDNAMIVTAIDPVYLEPFLLRGTHRRIIPISRDVEYAAQVISPAPLGPVIPPPDNPVKPRIDAIFRAGARDVVPFTADENPDLILDWARKGLPVYIELRGIPQNLQTRNMAIAMARVLKQVPH